MSYQVLARKWRPRRFQDMVGQETILQILTNALEQKRLHHAYLFTGTRGVGKTTLARLLAKCLNCESGVTSTPCGTCSACLSIDAGQCLDVFEVDAASRTKVEDTRELLDNILYPPTHYRYKIYLIDEVHMLSHHSFNALLKTLEEPPEHVKFLLATTDPKRLPITILSRCLQFHLKRMTLEQIVKHLQTICETEKFQYEIPALEKIAQAADGSMRDALSLLDQAVAFCRETVSDIEVSTLLGNIARDDILPFLEALSTQDGKQLFSLMASLAEHAPDFSHVLEEFITLFHDIAITQVLPDVLSTKEKIRELAKQFTPEEIQLYYQIALLGRRDLALTPSMQQGFEMTMLRMLAFKPSLTITQETAPFAIAAIAEEKKEPILATHASVVLTEWRDILPKLELSGMAYALASNCTLKALSEHKIELALGSHHQSMLNAKLKERITESLTRYFKRPMELTIQLTADTLLTPVKRQQHEREAQLTQATQTVLQNPHLKKLIDMYDATVEVSLISC